MTTRRALIAGGLAAGLCGGRAAAQIVYPQIPMDKVFGGQESWLRTPVAQRSQFKLTFVMRSGDLDPVGMPIDIVRRGGAKRRLTFNQIGMILDPPTLAELEAGAFVWPQMNLHGVGLSVNRWMQPTVLPSTAMDAVALRLAIEQGNRWMRRSGLVGRFIPPLTKVQLTGARGGVAVDAQGGRTPLPRYKGKGEPFYNPAINPGAVTLELERAPSLPLLQLTNMGGDTAS